MQHSTHCSVQLSLHRSVQRSVYKGVQSNVHRIKLTVKKLKTILMYMKESL